MTVRGWADLGLGAVAFAVAFAFSYGPGTLRMSLGPALVVAAVAAGAVWLSGHHAVPALVVVVALVAALPAARLTVEVLDLVVVLVVVRVITGSAVPVAAVGAVCLAALTGTDVWQRVAFGRSFAEPSVLYPLLLTALSVGIGVQARRIRQQQAALEAFRDRDRERAVGEERRRIARDLHDVAASHLSALVVRNKLARRLDTPAALAEAADFTARTTAEALAAMRQVVHVLGAEPDSDPPRGPHPGLAELDRVVGRMEAAGLSVHRTVAPVGPLPAPVEIAVVRIAQEALSNVLRHRGPGDCWLAVERHDGQVRLRVEDDGPAPPRPGTATGFGLVGMHERARSCGGSLDVGPSGHGGWAVTAVLPAEPARVESR